MREDTDDPLYLIGDHLGSTSLVLDTTGMEVAKQSYLPFGEDWGVSATDLPTDFTFTGQREAAEIGLMYYVARWYDSDIGHFIQADSIVPGAGNPMAWNRFGYAMYNPIVNIDPNGHDPDSAYEGALSDYDDLYELEGEFVDIDARCILRAVRMVADKLGELMGLNPLKAFWIVYGVVTFTKEASFNYNGDVVTAGAATISSNHIKIATMTTYAEPRELRGTNHMIHELGHAFASTRIGKGAYSALGFDIANNPLLGRDPTRPGSYGFTSHTGRFDYQVASTNLQTPNEIFADMFVGYITGKWYTGNNDNYAGPKYTSAQAAEYVDMAHAKSAWIGNFMVNLFGNNYLPNSGNMVGN